MPNWRHFPVLVLEFELEMCQSFLLPPFSGSMFRGCLGWALKEVCSDSDYRYLFETSSEESGQHDATRPFLLMPPIEQRSLRRGDRFEFSLHLFGRACDHVQSFVEAVKNMARRGLGSERAPFELRKIVVNDGPHRWVCFDQNKQAYWPLPSALGSFVPESPALPVCELEIEFVTPTRFMHRGQRVFEPHFHILLRNAMRRLDGLLQHHGGHTLDADFRAEIAQAEEVIFQPANVQWADWERTSQRQSRRHIMGGLVGTARYRGHIKPAWLDWLAASRILHLGKATTFGMGAFRLRVTQLQTALPPPPVIVRKPMREEFPIAASQ